MRPLLNEIIRFCAILEDGLYCGLAVIDQVVTVSEEGLIIMTIGIQWVM